ncbi:hypothetical protein GCM10027160_01920 [Streptomyces calidiresistens]
MAAPPARFPSWTTAPWSVIPSGSFPPGRDAGRCPTGTAAKPRFPSPPRSAGRLRGTLPEEAP